MFNHVMATASKSHYQRRLHRYVRVRVFPVPFLVFMRCRNVQPRKMTCVCDASAWVERSSLGQAAHIGKPIMLLQLNIHVYRFNGNYWNVGNGAPTENVKATIDLIKDCTNLCPKINLMLPFRHSI